MDTAIATNRSPGLPSSRFHFAQTWAGRYLTPFLTSLAVLLMSAALVFTIYFTQLDLEWTAFLFGVLFAAVLSLVSQNIKVQWRLVRRTAQLKRTKELMAEEIARTERTAQALKVNDARYRAVLDGLPLMVFFVDREERCRYHNAAFEGWCGRGGEDIARLPLSGLVDATVYQELKSHGSEALFGLEKQYEARWPGPDGASDVAVKLLPYPPGAQSASGYYAFVSRVPVARQPAGARSADGTEAAYFDAIEQELTADENPREYLLSAIEEDRFLLLEQKIEPLAAVGAGPADFREILLRLTEEDERTLAPGGFFEVAEHYDLMPAIDRWVIRKLLRSCAMLKEADRSWRMPLYGVNLSAATLADRAFANHVHAQLQHWEIAGSRLCFEIGQAALAEREADIAFLMQELKPLGCRFAVDAFGSQKVSFAPFRNLKFDFLKVDGGLVSRITQDNAERAKAGAIVLACRKIGVQTIAQRVEDEPTRAKLCELGFDFVQGFGVDKPGPLEIAAPLAQP